MPHPLTERAVSPEMGEAANAALETLRTLHQHKQRCMQCRVSMEFCDTGMRYRQVWLEDYATWERLKERVR